jgi:DNA repair protein RadC
MSKTELSINQWAEEDRPREKMAQKGAVALSDAELLAILIGSGTPDESAVALMRRLMNDCDNNLNTLGKMSLDDLMGSVLTTDEAGRQVHTKRYKGLGMAKAITILAACELGKRRSMTAVQERSVMKSPDDLYAYFHPIMQDLDREECYILLMNHSSRVLAHKLISRGGITETSVDVRLILHEALVAQATTVALCHNHPSGMLRPSMDDDRITARLKKACDIMNIRLLDHIIVVDGGYYSYQREGKLG